MTKEQIIDRIHSAIPAAPFAQQIKRVALFGSYAYGKPSSASDVDLLIEFISNEEIGVLEMVQLQNYFEKVLDKKVDLLTPENVSRYIRTEVIHSSQPIYEVRSALLTSHT